MCVSGLFVVSGCGSIDVPSGAGSVGCGDGVCDSVETWENCPADCPDPALCGDGTCQKGEAQHCPADCPGASTSGICGDGALDEGEACDCGASVMSCASDEQDILGHLEGGPVITEFTCADADPERPYGVVRCVDCSLRLQGCSDTY